MNEKYIKYQIESIVNKKLQEQKIIDDDTYKLIEDKLIRLLYELRKEELSNKRMVIEETILEVNEENFKNI